MAFSLDSIAQALGARLEGDAALQITGASEPALCGAQDLALAMDPKYAEGLPKGKAQAAILWDGADWQGLNLKAALFVGRPRLAMAHLSKIFDPGPQIAPGIHPSAVVDPSARIGPGAAIGPLTVIGVNARIGANARIVGQATIAEEAVIGDDALICSGVRIGARVRIGDRVILQPGVALGGDGFAFVTPEKSSVEQVRETLGDRVEVSNAAWTRLHSLGTVEIGDDVEIGANSTVDRGTIRATKIGRGTKIDNLVQVGHNVEIGEDCMLCGLVGVAGSTRIGNRVVLAGQVGVNDNIFIGDDVVAGGASKIFTNVPAGRVILGYPAIKMTTHNEIYKALRRLPRILRDVSALKKAVSLPDQSN
ncbi:UDP-3-O-(3-hydroxymyristoyl)glucosamine N-acyltransferase [Fluviibacterium sp. DFM31]|uniref:UDP-3-O-acylglucosamine N-acyltransferase n=1 Tax=Meridianimarinicoccus marinus TaxID=3231483 RepID=A0ABV3L8I2_9RHOB